MLFINFRHEVVFDSVERTVSFGKVDFDEFGHGSFLKSSEETFVIELIEASIESFLKIILLKLGSFVFH